jgi:predicted nucleic acid-binding Zn ribbon protein
VGVVFKGSGFYKTDSKSESKPANPVAKEKPSKPASTESAPAPKSTD